MHLLLRRFLSFGYAPYLLLAYQWQLVLIRTPFLKRPLQKHPYILYVLTEQMPPKRTDNIGKRVEQAYI